jgi:2Fe-2S ferredoxin
MTRSDGTSISVTFESADGKKRRVAAPLGESLMNVAVDAGIDGIEGRCGGALCCATCHIHVAPEWREWLPPPEADESDMLAFVAGERTAASRLSCQIPVTPALDGLTVTIPPLFARGGTG